MGRSNQKVNVVARHDVIKYRKTKALLRFKTLRKECDSLDKFNWQQSQFNS
jgi:hypothetical protein